MKKTPIRRVSAKQAKINRQWYKLVLFLIQFRARGKCEICNKDPDSRGLQGAHIERRMPGNYIASNCIVACAVCHDHSKYGDGLSIGREKASALVAELNKKYGIKEDWDGS